MKTHKLLIPVLTVGFLALSCSKSSTPAVGTTQAQQAFGNVNTSLASDLGGLSAAPGGKAMNSFSSLSGTPGNPMGRIASFKSLTKPGEITAAVNASIATFRQMIIKSTATARVQGNTPFDYPTKVGVYTWSKANKSFSKTGSSSIVEIDYPSDTTSATNDAALKITAYSEVSTPQGYNPTLIQASITINGTVEASLKLTAGYDSNGDTNKASIDLFVNPYTVTFSFDNSQSTSASESFSFSKSGKLLIAMGINVAYASATDKTNGNPSSVSGYVQLLNVRFTAVIDGSKVATAQTPNDFIFITVTVDGGVAGHVVWVYDQQTAQYEPYMKYNDQTETPLKTLFADLATQLSALGIG